MDIVERLRDYINDTNDCSIRVEAADEIERLRAENAAIKQQARQWKMEALTQASIVRECYQICTGSTGEPGDWNGAEPVRKLAAENAALRTGDTCARQCEGTAYRIEARRLASENAELRADAERRKRSTPTSLARWAQELDE